jgi:hypothetical protein
MTATTATDAGSPPVQYYFECTNDGSKSSGWQSSSTYIASGLTPSTLYSFRVRARDSYSTPNVTGYSSTQSATTGLPGTDVEIIGSWGTGLSHTRESGTNRALIFIAHGERSGTMDLTAVTYGGQSMNEVVARYYYSGNGAYASAYILNEAGVAAAINNNFVVTWNNAPTEVKYASVFLQNVNQTALTGASGGGEGTSNPVTTPALATNDGDVVILGATCGNLGTYTLNNGFTLGVNQSSDSSTGATGHKSATGVPETPSASHSSVNRQVIIGFVVKGGIVIDEPPAAPTGLTAVAGNQMVSLDWNNNAEPDLASYNVYRSTTSGSGYGKLNVALVSSSNYIDNTVTNGIPYYYVVTAVDANDHESGNSNEATATPDYQDCGDVQDADYGLLSDINGDCYVNYIDLKIITDNWLRTDCTGPGNCEGADFEPTDGYVDLADYSTFAEQWLLCNDPTDVSCTPNWP